MPQRNPDLTLWILFTDSALQTKATSPANTLNLFIDYCWSTEAAQTQEHLHNVDFKTNEFQSSLPRHQTVKKKKNLNIYKTPGLWVKPQTLGKWKSADSRMRTVTHRLRCCSQCLVVVPTALRCKNTQNTKNFFLCVLRVHIQSNTTTFHLVVL